MLTGAPQITLCGAFCAKEDTMLEPRNLLLTGFVLLLLGFFIPFLILLHFIPSTFLLNFIAFGASIVGLILGFIGIAFYVERHRR